MKNTEKWGHAKAEERTVGYKRGGHINKHRTKFPSSVASPLPPPLPPEGLAGTPGAPGVTPVAPGGAGPFKKGGNVTAGAMSGPGRLQKGKWYGG